MRRPFLKVCCITDEAEARLAIQLGADAVGLVGAMPSGPGVISDADAARIAASIPPPVDTWLLTSRTDAASIAAHADAVGATTVQIVDAVELRAYPELRRRLPGRRLVQAVHVVDASSLETAAAVAPHVDAVLLDSGTPDAAVKELGGTGRTHDWALSRRIVEHLATLTRPSPVWLADGLRPKNVAEAVRAVQPWGVGRCSGVRTDGALDANKLRAFVAEIHHPD